MPAAVQSPDGLEPHPSQSQDQSHCPNFSRPRRGRRRNYSTGLPFQYRKNNSHKTLQNGDSPTGTTGWAKNVSVDAAGKRPCTSPKMDDMIVDSEQRRLAEERQCAEEDVREAFKRWDVSDKARKKLRQPPSIGAHRDALSIPEPHVRNSHERRKGKEKGPTFEKVEGVQLDTRPGRATGPYRMEETLPEIEAQDIREIPARSTFSHTLPSDLEDDQDTLTSLTAASGSESGGASSQLWSESSRSSFTASTENSNPKPYQHVSEEYMSSNEDNHEILEQVMGSHQVTVRRISAAILSELDSQQGPAARQQPASSLKVQKLPLEVIDEESRDSVVGNVELDAAPAPHVKGIKDEAVMSHALHVLARSKQANAIRSPENATLPVHSTPPPRVLVAAGIGDDKHVYELEAAVPAGVKTSRSDTSTDAMIVDHIHAHGILDKVEHGVSKVVNALHEKVKKTVTFSPVNDVRFMTPSPYPYSIDNTNAVDVDTPR